MADYTITLQAAAVPGEAGGKPDSRPVLDKTAGDRVRWKNDDDRGHTMVFSVWPFVEAPFPIPVEPGKSSDWYTVCAYATSRGYDYSIIPEPATTGPPDPPDLDVGP